MRLRPYEEDSLVRQQVRALQERVESLEKERALQRKELKALSEEKALRSKELKTANDLVMALSRNLQAETKAARVLEEKVGVLEQQVQGTNQLVVDLLDRLNKKEDHGQLRVVVRQEKVRADKKEDIAKKRGRDGGSDIDVEDPSQPRLMEVDLQGGQQHSVESKNGKDGRDGPTSPKKPRPAARDGERDTDEEWEAKRKKTVIFKGLPDSSHRAVVGFLAKYDFAKENNVMKVECRNVKSQKWIFVLFNSVRTVDHIMSTKAKKLKGMPIFAQRDLSKAARSKEREERLKRNAQPQLIGVHPQRRAQIDWPAQPSSPQQSNIAQQQVTLQMPTVTPPNGQHNFPQVPNGRMVGAPPLRVSPQQVPYYIRPGNQLQPANSGLLSLYNPHLYQNTSPPLGWVF
jgi:hypothetical protein